MQAFTAPRSIVVFRALQLGDLLCAVPALRALRIAHRGARITLLGLPWAATFVRRFRRYVDAFIAFPGFPGLGEQRPDVANFPAFLAEMHRRRFDVALQMHGSGRHSNALVQLLGARDCAGFHPVDEPPLPTGRYLPYPADLPEVARNLCLVELLGCPPAGEYLEFPLEQADFDACASLPGVCSLEPGRYVCLHPGARAASKRWPPERFARVGDALHEAGYRVVLTGSAQERPITQAVVRAMKAPSLDCACDVSIGGLAALIAGARLLVCNDTGVSHVAAGLALPSVVVFFATDPMRWAPLDGDCHRVVYDPAGVEVDAVLAEAFALLAVDRARSRHAPLLAIPPPPRRADWISGRLT